MIDKKQAECPRIREVLQELHDTGGAPDRDMLDHVLHCPDCAAFEAFLENLPSSLRDALDAAASSMSAPRYARVTPLPRKRRFSARQLTLAALAAGLLAVAIPASILTATVLRERAAMQETVAAYVNDLFRSSTTERVESAGNTPPSPSQALDSLLNDLAED